MQGTTQSQPAPGGLWHGQSSRLVVALFAVIWVLFALVATVVIHTLDSSQQHDFARIAADPAVTRGVVTLADPGNHDSFLYQYRVGQASFTGGSYPQANVQPEAASLHAGETLSVFYDRRDPALSCACDPRASADQNHWWQALIAGLFLTSIGAVVATIWALRWVRRPQTATRRGRMSALVERVDAADHIALKPRGFWIRLLPVVPLAGAVAAGTWRALGLIDQISSVSQAPGTYAAHYPVPVWPILMFATAFGLGGLLLLSGSYWQWQSDRNRAQLESALSWAERKPNTLRGKLAVPLGWLLGRETRRRNSRTAQLCAATAFITASLTMVVYTAIR